MRSFGAPCERFLLRLIKSANDAVALVSLLGRSLLTGYLINYNVLLIICCIAQADDKHYTRGAKQLLHVAW